MGELWQMGRDALGVGLGPGMYSPLQMALRGVVVYGGGLAIVRLGGHRFLGRQAAFDTILAFILGSVLSRAINGHARIVPTLVATAVVVGLHRLLADLAFRSPRFGQVVKGGAQVIVRDGEILWNRMRRHGLSRGDLDEALRLHGRIADPAAVGEARFERNGSISVLPKKGEPRVVDVRVAEGVQTVRIELG
jgi:uncharacterized membrane protein YcaP (DUF421 family)